SYLADGRKVKAVYKTYSTGIVVPQDSVYHGKAPYDVSTDEWDGHYMYRSWYGRGPRMFIVQTPEGYVGADYIGIDSHGNYAYYYYIHDHLGNVRITRNSQDYYSDQSLEYYPSGVLFDRSTEKDRQPYMFDGKELVSMHGLNEYDFTGRWQDPAIPSFTSMDPLCEKYYSVSPYVYCGNNPVNAFDLNGDSIWYTVDRDVVTMHVTGKVINDSSDDINMSRAASDIASDISKAFNGAFEMDGESYILQTDIQLSVVNSMDRVEDSDHLFVFLEADGKSGRGAVNKMGGKVINVAASDYANDNWFSNTFFSNETRTAVHEFGHAAGLTHRSVGSSLGNLMTPVKNGTNVTSTQRQMMLNVQGQINKGSNYIMRDKKYPYPYVHDFQTGVVYTAKMLLNWDTMHKKR
ncbi:RHS repeat-associated core domain-containing protein, partial [Bacteroides sp.]